MRMPHFPTAYKPIDPGRKICRIFDVRLRSHLSFQSFYNQKQVAARTVDRRSNAR